MKTDKSQYSFVALVFSATLSFSQPLLTPEEAVRIGLENNFSISLARGEAAIAVNNRKAGLGPFLPNLSASVGQSGILDSSSINPQTTVGGSLTWQIFDGFQSYHAYQNLKSQEAAAQLQEQITVETTLESILVSYFDIVSQNQRMTAIRELLAVSEERARLSQAKLELGAGSRLEQLQSLADLNEDSSAFLSQEEALKAAHIRLNQLLARDAAIEFTVMDSIPLDALPPLAQWRTSLAENNTSIRQALTRRGAARYEVKGAQGGRLPDINAELRYSATPEALNSGPPGEDRRSGIGYGISLSLPIFDRFDTRRRVGGARLGLRQEETRLQQTEKAVHADFEAAEQAYTTGSRRIALEERNLEVARLQEEAARERFRVGATSSLEFRDAQRRLLDAISRLTSARHGTKEAELALKRLAGVLVRQAPDR